MMFYTDLIWNNNRTYLEVNTVIIALGVIIKALDFKR